MDIVIGGAGAVGKHLAEVFSIDGASVTVVELDPAKLESLENELDVRTLRANCAHADALREAGVDHCDVFVAATNNDEINLLSASVASGIGAGRCVARIHHQAYFDSVGMDYPQHFGIDHLICPEYVTATAIARSLRNPGSLAVEKFARGKIEMQELRVSENAPALGIPLSALQLPKRVRIATITRDDRSFIPNAETAIAPNDIVTLVGDKEDFDAARKMLQTEKVKRKRVVVMGGTAMGVWVCRALRHRHFAVHLYVSNRQRAEELAEKLPKVTVLDADPTDPTIFTEEHIEDADAFIALTNDDEHNILAAAQAKSWGAKFAIAVTERSTYMRLLKHVGIDRAFSPRIVAAREIQLLLKPGPVRVLASLARAEADVYEITVGKGAPATGSPLKDIKFPGPIVIAAIQRGEEVHVPGAQDTTEPDDIILAIGRRDMEKPLKKLFAG